MMLKIFRLPALAFPSSRVLLIGVLAGSLALVSFAVAFFIPKNQKFEASLSLATPNNKRISHPAVNESATSQPEELGQVHWLRDLDLGKAESQQSGKPLLILFQEVPGCSNCTRFGNTTLSNPLIVETIETYFIPVCIFNNKGGKEAEALHIFNEPAWNNPVVRIVRNDYQDVVPRMPNFNASLQLVNGIRRALNLTSKTSPRYLELLEEELSAREGGLQTTTFSMYCFWTGEGTFGAIPGVIETEPGYQDGKEVVKIQFDPDVTNRAELEKLTQPKNMTACAKNDGFHSDHEPKYYLAQTDYRYIPMTSLQACRVNSLIGKRQSPDELLSPRQLDLLKKVAENPKKDWKNMVGHPLEEMWQI